MAEDDIDPPALQDPGGSAEEPGRPRCRRSIVLGALAGLLLLAFAYAWMSRERIARDVISGELGRMGLPATYRIESIGTGSEVLRNIVIGDPKHPDLTIERVSLAIEPRWGIPGFGRITLQKPRLYGTYRGGKLNFGRIGVG